MELSKLAVLSEQDLNAIHEASVDILQTCGIHIPNRRMLDFFTTAHYTVILETPTRVERAFTQGREVDLSNRHKRLWNKYQGRRGHPGYSSDVRQSL